MVTRRRFNIIFLSVLPLLSVKYVWDDLVQPDVYHSPFVIELYLSIRGSKLSSIPFRKYSLGLLNVI
jgi:hypothetical protein